MVRSYLKNSYFALRQGGTYSESAVYRAVHEHRGISPNAVLKQKSIFKTASKLKGPLNVAFSFQGIVCIFLVLCVLSSALAVVVSKHLNRRLHIQLQQLQQARDALHIEWSRLLLEQGTLGSDARVEQVAREQLGMTVPAANQIMVLKP